jgi:hypothetical protein
MKTRTFQRPQQNRGGCGVWGGEGGAMIITEEDARAFLRGLFAAYNKRDWETFFGEYVWEDCLFVNGDGIHSGREKMIQFWEEAIFRTKEETLLEPVSVFVRADQIAAELPLKLYFKQDDTYAGVRFKKGDEITLRCADFYKLRNGKISEFTVYRFTPWWLKDWAGDWVSFERIVRRDCPDV